MSTSAPPSARNSSIAPRSASASTSRSIRYDGKAFKKLSSTFGDEVVTTPDELKGVFDGPPLRRDATIDGHPAALYLGQIKNYAGQPVGILEIIKDTTEYEAAAASSAAQSDPRHDRHPGRRGRAGVPARSRPVAPTGRDHRGHEPPFRRRDRRHDPRQRAPRRTRHHGRARSTCSAAA